MKLHRTLVVFTIVVLLLTTAAHAMSLFVESPPANDTEKQLFDLMTTYKLDAGAGFHPTMSGLFTALSSCFSILTLFGALLLIYLPKRIEPNVLKGLLTIMIVCFAICFGFMAALTFLPPIVCSGLILAGLIGARFTIPTAQLN
jgi:hypothetical protein